MKWLRVACALVALLLVLRPPIAVDAMASDLRYIEVASPHRRAWVPELGARLEGSDGYRWRVSWPRLGIELVALGVVLGVIEAIRLASRRP